MESRARKAIEGRLDDASQMCLRRNAQLTELRRTVLGLILQAERPPTAYQLLDQLRPTRKGVAPPTVYRTLEFLIENKLIHKVERLNAFIPCTDADHDHTHDVQFLICQTCGKVREMEERSVSRALENAARKHGFEPALSIVEVEGTCGDCQDNASTG